MGGIRRTRPCQFGVGKPPLRPAVDRKRCERETVEGARLRFQCAVRRVVRRDYPDFVESEEFLGRLARAKVSVVNWIKRAAEHAKATVCAHALRRRRAARRSAASRSVESSNSALVVSAFTRTC